MALKARAPELNTMISSSTGIISFRSKSESTVSSKKSPDIQEIIQDRLEVVWHRCTAPEAKAAELSSSEKCNQLDQTMRLGFQEATGDSSIAASTNRAGSMYGREGVM